MSQKEKVIPLIDDNVNQIENLITEKLDVWFEHVLFSGLWWFGLALSIVPWIFWWRWRKRESSDRLLFAGLE
ncbi:hypothetical protein ACFFHM_14920 [Halalkalibacter kiskunsagensis]|uniref:Uncharacterized protein n=1 Tax=Halalkalibacter kiskunsagensis TaxID=1548599 RepID=A0ABV6KFM2_9BACI